YKEVGRQMRERMVNFRWICRGCGRIKVGGYGWELVGKNSFGDSRLVQGDGTLTTRSQSTL
ncbi:MAG: hypothetical protein ND866_02420, partial [Pyrinomonadaceae bacterium]|nr:hypothetical protein [Pyrinomonadaceae bacterium]